MDSWISELFGLSRILLLVLTITISLLDSALLASDAVPHVTKLAAKFTSNAGRESSDGEFDQAAPHQQLKTTEYQRI